MTKTLPFKIISNFRPSDRIEEYVREVGNLPRSSSGSIDYWQMAKDLCKKDGGRLPTMEELAQLASYIYGEEIGEMEDKYDLTVKNHIEGFDPSEGLFGLWSSSPYGTEIAYYRYFYDSDTGYNNNYRSNDSIRAVCLATP